ncbi:hypothetical protein BH11MYX3_BH11MYX3_26340 [soil metagenome]
MVVAILLGTATAAADDATSVKHHAQVHAYLCLSVIQLAYEHPFGQHVAASLSGGVFGSYFLPWFDVGDDVIGVGAGIRVTWFARETGRGFYLAPYLRAHRVSGDHDDMHGTGLGFSTGAFAGWALGITNRLDLRLGAGAQYIRHSLDTPAGTHTSSTPFIALDILVGYRL